MRAHALATVLSNDAVNVFITLSARALNPNLSIVARGELSSTESKLLQAGADKVVLPTHIGAERIAEVILCEESARFIEGLERSHGFQRDVFTSPPATTVVGEGDGVVLIGRPNRVQILTSLFEPQVRGARG